MSLTLAFVLGLVAAVLAAVELFRTRGQDLVAWAVLFVALAGTFSRL